MLLMSISSISSQKYISDLIKDKNESLKHFDHIYLEGRYAKTSKVNIESSGFLLFIKKNFFQIQSAYYKDDLIEIFFDYKKNNGKYFTANQTKEILNLDQFKSIALKSIPLIVRLYLNTNKIIDNNLLIKDLKINGSKIEAIYLEPNDTINNIEDFKIKITIKNKLPIESITTYSTFDDYKNSFELIENIDLLRDSIEIKRIETNIFTSNSIKNETQDSSKKENIVKKIQSIVRSHFDNKNIEGEYFFVDLWFINCPGCIKSHDLLNWISEQPNNKIGIIGINDIDNKESIEKYISKKGIRYDKMIPSIKFNSELPYPTFLILNKNLDILKIWEGYSEEIKNEIKDFILKNKE